MNYTKEAESRLTSIAKELRSMSNDHLDSRSKQMTIQQAQRTAQAQPPPAQSRQQAQYGFGYSAPYMSMGRGRGMRPAPGSTACHFFYGEKCGRQEVEGFCSHRHDLGVSPNYKRYTSGGRTASSKSEEQIRAAVSRAVMPASGGPPPTARPM